MLLRLHVNLLFLVVKKYQSQGVFIAQTQLSGNWGTALAGLDCTECPVWIPVPSAPKVCAPPDRKRTRRIEKKNRWMLRASTFSAGLSLIMMGQRINSINSKTKRIQDNNYIVFCAVQSGANLVDRLLQTNPSPAAYPNKATSIN